MTHLWPTSGAEKKPQLSEDAHLVIILMISLYVDDILVAGSDLDEVERIKQQFTEHYEMKDLGELNYYLGMKITRFKSLGFKQCVADNCLFVKRVSGKMYLISLYVDDILVAGSDLDEVERIKQ